MFGPATLYNWLWLIAAGFAVGLGWAVAGWLVGKILR